MDIHIHIYTHGRPWNIPGTLLLLEIPNVPKGRSTDHHGALSVHWADVSHFRQRGQRFSTIHSTVEERCFWLVQYFTSQFSPGLGSAALINQRPHR